MKNIFIVGGSGFLGYYLLKILKKNYNVYAHQNKTLIKEKNINIVKLNLYKKSLLRIFLNKNNISTVVNLSSVTNVETCEKYKLKAKKIHVNFLDNLVKSCLKKKIKIVHISTDHIFSGAKNTAYSENDKAFPINYYGKTKYLGEEIVKQYRNHLILRTNFFGKNLNSKKSFSDKIYYNLKKKIQINIWSDIYFSPLHVRNVAFIICYLINKKATGVYHLSSSKVSKYKFSQQIAKILKLEKKLIAANLFDTKKFVNRPRNMSLSNLKIKKKFPELKNKLSLKNQLNLLKSDYIHAK